MTSGVMPVQSKPTTPEAPVDDLDTIKQQLAEMQEKLSKMGK